MILCWLVLIAGALVVEAFDAFRYTRRRLRARLEAYLHVFAVWPLVVAVGALAYIVFR
jgi:hypothetical protein